mmetsp:Transcript_41210/g.129110  ORF Transcript_41210/g.129110 Transcript_41210/m.129110 type:complete len:222 (+) Transcript_41210:1364-2029(+)
MRSARVRHIGRRQHAAGQQAVPTIGQQSTPESVSCQSDGYMGMPVAWKLPRQSTSARIHMGLTAPARHSAHCAAPWQSSVASGQQRPLRHSSGRVGGRQHGLAHHTLSSRSRPAKRRNMGGGRRTSSSPSRAPSRTYTAVRTTGPKASAAARSQMHSSPSASGCRTTSQVPSTPSRPSPPAKAPPASSSKRTRPESARTRPLSSPSSRTSTGPQHFAPPVP